MNIAIVPWGEGALGNQMFREKRDKTHPHDNNVQWLESNDWVRLWFKERKHRYETIDQYKDWEEIDYILVYAGGIHKRYVSKFLKMGYENKLIYLAIEPEIGYKEHRKEQMPKLLKYYKYILTWNKEAADGKRIFQADHYCVLKYREGGFHFLKESFWWRFILPMAGDMEKKNYIRSGTGFFSVMKNTKGILTYTGQDG